MVGLLKRLLGWDTQAGGGRARAHRDAVRNARSPAAHRAPQPPAPERSGTPAGHELSLDTKPGDGFDPYNTGVFDRGASWDRVGKSGR